MVLRYKKHNDFFSCFTIFAFFSLFAVSLAFVSCSDILSPLNVAPGTSSAQEGEVVVISGSVAADFTNVAGAAPSLFVGGSPANDGGVTSDAQGRMAMPSPTLSENGRTYFVEAYYTTEMQPVEGVVTAGTATGGIFSGTYTIALTTGHKWTVELGVKSQETGESEPTKKLVAKYTYPNNLTASDAATALDLTLRPSQESTGSISLGITFPSSVKHIGLIGFNGDSEENFDVDGTSFSIEKTNIASGAYPATLIFYNSSNNEIYSYDQVINVYDNLKTDTWYGDGTSNCPINSSHLFGVTDAMIAAYARTNFYVSNTGNNDTADGSAQNPYATVGGVLERIGNGTAGTDYIIRLKTDIQEMISIQSSTDNSNALINGTLTIRGYGTKKTIKKPNSNVTNIINVATTVPVTIENVTLENTSIDDDCLGLYAGTNSNVTLRNCDITKTYRTNGSAVWNSGGTVTLEECNIYGCVSETGSGGNSVLIYNCNILKVKDCNFYNIQNPAITNTTEYVILNNAATNQLTLSGDIRIPTNSTQKNAIYGYPGIKIGDNFSCSEKLRLTLFTYELGSTILEPVTTGATSVVANAASHFVLADTSYMIGTTGTDIGKAVYNPHIYVASASSNPPGSNSNGDGTAEKPYETLNLAIEHMSKQIDYIIHVSGIVKAENGAAVNASVFGITPPTSVTIRGTDPESDGISWMSGITTVNNTTIKILGISTHLENLKITGGHGSNGGGVFVDNGTSVWLKNCIVTGNNATDYGGGVYVSGTGQLTIEDSSITGNSVSSGGYGGGIYFAGSLSVSGDVNITDNTYGSDPSDHADNVYLKTGKVITVADTLDEDSRISVTTQTTPAIGGTPVALTSGLSGKGTTANFVSDNADLSVVTSSGEAALGKSGGNVSNVFDYAVTLSCDTSIIKLPVSGSKTVTVSAAITKNGAALPSGETVAIDWSVKLLYNAEEIGVSDGATASAVASIPLNIPSSKLFYMESQPYYTLYAKATINGITYDAEFPIKVFDPLVGFVSVDGMTVSTAITNGTYTSPAFGGSSVTIPNLYVCDHEVTQAEYVAIMGTNPSEGSSGAASGEIQEKRPVEKVTWCEAIVYCNKRSIAEEFTPCYTVGGSTNPDDWGNVDQIYSSVECNFAADGYRLPKDAEWEYLARGGSALSTDKYSGTDSETNIYNYAWFGDNSDGKTHEVKKKLPNSLGIYDMSGNVCEWCWDIATGGNGVHRYDRGSHWNHMSTNTEFNRYIYSQYWNSPTTRYADIGIRVVRTRN